MPQESLQNYGRTTVSDFLGDMIVYRNLLPMHPELPALPDLRSKLGLAPNRVPRKSESDYARVIAALLQYAQARRQAGAIHRLIYVGDTRLNDGQAFANLCRTSGWQGIAFIGSESGEPAEAKVIVEEPGTLYLANRWSMLGDFDAYCSRQGMPVDGQTAVVLDLDKTTLGARGRNDHVINAARVEAVRRTVDELLGEDFDAQTFERAYETLNQTVYHPFTTDNQDYLAAICLVVGNGLMTLDSLITDIESGKLRDFEDFLEVVNTQADALPPHLQTLHGQIYERVKAGDPTPFKAFRYNEYLTTIERFGNVADEAPAADRLDREIVITQEVRDIAVRWRAQGALLFGLSDKPDEASIPTEALRDQGYAAIHATQTHAVGGKTE
jgi:hypothetical protein